MAMLLLFICCLMVFTYKSLIDSRGFWIGDDAVLYHYTDYELANALVDFFKKERAESIVDFGCGMGDYAKLFLKNGFAIEAFDGNPATPQLTGGIGQIQDLSKPFYIGKNFDWVLSLEVGEHLPKEYEVIFIENLIRHCEKGIILSWAVKGQKGHGHSNCQNNEYIKKAFAEYGFLNDPQTEMLLRKSSTQPWFKDTIMVFLKPSGPIQWK